MIGRISLPTDPAAAAVARRHLERACPHLPTDTLSTALLLVSELVANAVQHARRDLALGMTVGPDHMHVEVFDGDSRPPVLQPFSLTDEHCRGLFVVDTYADRWGVTHLGRGKCVWFELTWA